MKNPGRDGRPKQKKGSRGDQKSGKGKTILIYIFSRLFLFHFIDHLSLPFFRFDLPSLPWFFLSHLIVHPFLPWSPALAFQALPLAHRSSPLDPRHPIQTIQSSPPTPPGARDRARPLINVTKLRQIVRDLATDSRQTYVIVG